ncbi:SDR family NAD(P)-dependent oxidoreductase [Dactylosporangium sp. CA-092794]|uniref:SDR family NAD(P)-dependent oxidoreductase n=1 Tax=Dactylosporangium sp. CA-092794 TaxID=3239929 RepID=UPI003D8EF142
MSAGRIAGKIALITAAGSGMGRASAELFAAEGATVIVADIDEAAASAVAKGIEDAGGSALPFAADVSDVAALRRMADFVAERFDRLDVLFNHAGIPCAPGLDVTEEQFDRAVGVNLKSAFFATSYLLPLLKAAGSASVIFTSSTSGLVASPSSPLYGMTKGGTQILMRSLAKQLGPFGIRSNAICPGPTDTPMLRVFTDPARVGLGDDDYARQLAARAQAIPLRRAGRPADVAATALFLACDDSAFVTGVAIPVDGGMLA